MTQLADAIETDERKPLAQSIPEHEAIAAKRAEKAAAKKARKAAAQAAAQAPSAATQPAGASKSDPPVARTAPPPSIPDHPIPAVVDPLLGVILNWPRKHDSLSEKRFGAWLETKLTGLVGKVTVTSLGCLVAQVPYPDIDNTASTTLFSCHVDTIDSEGPLDPAGLAKWKKRVSYDPYMGIISLDKDSIGMSLGADDGAGVWLMLKMLEAKVPGTYVFHRGEEVGGLGSREILKDQPEWLAGFEAAIAFDRAGYSDVIVEQGGIVCASDKFGQALANRLNEHGFDYSLSRRGTFTDTKVYRGKIAECVNLSVGYHNQHGRQEDLDYAHLVAMKDALIKIDWDSLPVDRDPMAPDPVYSYGSGSYGSSRPTWGDKHAKYGGFGYGRDEDDLFDDAKLKGSSKDRVKKVPRPPSGILTEYDKLLGTNMEDLTAWVESAPDDAALSIADLMMEVGRLRSDRDVLYKLSGLDLEL